MSEKKRTAPPAVAARAKSHPGEWLYEIVGSFGPHDPVPPEAIRGAWKVDDDGEIVGEFIPNKKFKEPGRDAAIP